MKKIIIFKYGDGELSNQLWNYISIYAYGLEKNVPVYNPSFYEYHTSFNLIGKESFFVRILARLFQNYTKRKSALWKKTWRKIYRLYTLYTEYTKKNQIISSDSRSNEVIALPPTNINTDLAQKENFDEVYFDGWLFRNKIGINKYRKQIISTFCPNGNVVKKIEKISKSFVKYERVIGVHIRQGDYATFKGGRYLVHPKRVREVIDEFTIKNNINLNTAIFIIASDGPIDHKIFSGLNYYISRENAVTDLFLLSSADVIIGSNSSFGHFASWYGNIPHIIVSNDPLDWDYYSFRKEYFENKYCTMVHF